jgi:hypothetical protein
MFLQSSQSTVATLISSEQAGWESALPTTPGSQLEPGRMVLKSGVATIRFHSGAEVVLEAPAELNLNSTMRGELVSGAAVIEVPESAIGFIIDTPNGYVVDHGTKFALKVDQARAAESFAVISGEISVHHPGAGAELRLTQDEESTMTATGVAAAEQAELTSAAAAAPNRQRLHTRGRASTIIRNRKLSHLNPDMLMVKTESKGGDFDRRALFGFDFSGVDLALAKTARIRLNLVPSGAGFAAYLPQQNRFVLYGLTTDAMETWQVGCLWDEAPTPEDCRLLTTFEIPRSKNRGAIWVDSDSILDFLKRDSNESVTLLLVRETGEEHKHGLVHAFASDSHPDASGTVLELSFGE